MASCQLLGGKQMCAIDSDHRLNCQQAAVISASSREPAWHIGEVSIRMLPTRETINH